MELKDVISIGGMPGLHKIVSHRPNGVIVETLDATARRFATNISQKISVLEDIAMFTREGDVKLGQVFLNCRDKAAEGVVIPGKGAGDDELRSFMDAVLPDWDRERIYLSDVKKLAAWFHVLNEKLDWDAVKKNLETPEEESAEEDTPAKTSQPKKPVRDVHNKVATPKGPNVKSQTKTPRKTGGA